SSTSAVRQGQKLRSCVYLHAVLDESLQLRPPVSAAQWYVVTPGGQRFNGHIILADTEVGTSPYSLIHSPAYFDEPCRFTPGRRIESESKANSA
ncbi:hypothetical protein A1O7_07814, partial [Cladophialophora yegresii CBS 114405]